jgi:XRE family aerobic/anaerobic benzoate catabolism transcriptional regulator
LSLRALAARSGLSTRFLTELEAGRANISVDRLASLAAALGSSAGTLLVDAEREAAGTLPDRIALVGLRGAGKSAVGRRLATRLAVPFFELDSLIEEAAGLSLRDVFTVHGEDWYRRLEADVLRRWLDEHERGVLATGGGIVGNAEAFRLLCERTTTVWLRARPEDHWNRVVRQGDLRPMAGRPAAQEELRRILESREALYARARFQIDTSRLGVGECVRRLVAEIRGRRR